MNEPQQRPDRTVRPASRLAAGAEPAARAEPAPGGTQNGAGQQSRGTARSEQDSGASQASRPRRDVRARTGGGGSEQQMRDVSEEMRNAASDLRRQDPGQASARGNRALEKSAALEQQLQSRRGPTKRRRALGEMQLEARQLADAERQVASSSGHCQGELPKDAVRRLAGEQDRLADRARTHGRGR